MENFLDAMEEARCLRPKMRNRLEKFMEKEGWVKWETMNQGVKYYSWRKNGFEIDEDGIEDIWRDLSKN